MSLFQDTSALGIMPDDIGGCPPWGPGVPEFGTDFAMQMLLDTKPKHFSDLGAYRRSGPWYGCGWEMPRPLIQEGKATIPDRHL